MVSATESYQQDFLLKVMIWNSFAIKIIVIVQSKTEIVQSTLSKVVL